MRGPPPHVPFAPAARETFGVPCASGPVRSHPYVLPGQAWPLGSASKAPQVQSRRLDGELEVGRAKFHEAIEPPVMYRDPSFRLSAAYLKPDEGIWDQSYLSKVLQQMKDSEIAKLKLPPSCNKPLGVEKWIMSLNTTMKGLHPEIGRYWDRATSLAERVYQQYLKDLAIQGLEVYRQRCWHVLR